MPVERSISEFSVKLQRVRSMMEQHGIVNLLITEAHHFSWLTGGAENFVFLAKSGGAAPLLVTPDRVVLVCDTIEAARLLPEEITGLPIETAIHDWYVTPEALQAHREQVSPGEWVTDTRVETHLQALHAPLLGAEVSRYRWLGSNAEEAIRHTCLEARPGMSEYQIAGRLAQACYDRKIWPVLTLVASDDRISNYRHPLPTDKPVQRNLMVVLCARRHGLIVNLTRMVSFGTPDEERVRKHQAVCHVDATLILTSKPGTPFGEILQKGIEAYREHGYPDEWKLHHQGGPTGYLGRYLKAIPESTARLQDDQAVAWNPSITGTKSEDTVFISGTGYENFTQPVDWPIVLTHTSEGDMPRCDILSI